MKTIEQIKEQIWTLQDAGLGDELVEILKDLSNHIEEIERALQRSNLTVARPSFK